jgi:signal transduction histidine kinase
LIGSNLFRKHFAIAAASVLSFVFFGSIASTLLIQRVIQSRSFRAPMSFVHAIEDLGAGDPVAGVKKVEAYRDGELPFGFSILDESGESLYGPMPEKSLADLPAKAHEAVAVGEGRYGVPEGFLVRLEHDPARYLYIYDKGVVSRPFPSTRLKGKHFSRHPGPPRPPGILRMLRIPPLFSLAFLALVLTVLVGIAFALFLIFRSLREHVETADHVISELQRGNLKARFPVKKNDEIGKAMNRFNQMADQIEQLVERLRKAEASRNLLLQDLTHDLRTPVASMRNLLETIFSRVEMSGGIRELSELAVKENDYIARLVEDLLLLAQVTEPKYKPRAGMVDILALVEEEGNSQELRRKGTVEFELDSSLEEALVAGDEQLLKRLVRNSLENAFSFARSKVRASIAPAKAGFVSVTIEDDGPGFDADSLKNFGERRSKRVVAKNENGRLSLGLGSVIMKTVVLLHGGEIEAANREGGGGRVAFTLPLS